MQTPQASENNPHRSQAKGIAMLLLTSLIWGSAFIAQHIGMESIDAFTFNGVRCVLAVCALAPVVLLRTLYAGKNRASAPAPWSRRLLMHGTILGIVFFTASNLQQFAFYDSSAGKIAFLTTLYLFFVPLFGLPFGKRIPRAMWGCICIGFVSLYFLCIDPADPLRMNRGDLLAVLCAMAFAVQILLIERFTREDDGVKLSFVQLCVTGALSLAMMFLFESPSVAAIRTAFPSLLYAGVLSSAVAYTLQIIGQARTEATLASLLMCTESVFALLASALVLHEYMRPRELFGSALLFCACVAGTVISGRAASRAQTRTPSA